MKTERNEKNNPVENEIIRSVLSKNIVDRNKSLEENLVFVYRWIRDLPFEAGLTQGDYQKDLMYVKTYKRGSCSQKHYLLGTICENFGISVEYLTFPFYWHELPVAYPNSLKNLAKRMPLTYHLAIRICVRGKKFLLDATWDSPLKKGKFPINKMGNKLMNTKIAVVPAGRYIVHTSTSKREEFVKAINISRGGKMSQEEIEFYSLLNAWLKELRKT